MKNQQKIFLSILYVAIVLFLSNSVFAAITITNDSNPDILRDAFVNDARITVKNVDVIGDARGFGTYQNGPLAIGDGIILATGDVLNALPPNMLDDAGTAFGLPGCEECDDIIIGYESFDATILTITFDAADINGISLDFIFGSEEYDEYVGSSFNDVFGNRKP